MSQMDGRMPLPLLRRPGAEQHGPRSGAEEKKMPPVSLPVAFTQRRLSRYCVGNGTVLPILVEDAVSLLSVICNALPDVDCRVIELIAPHHKAGVSSLARGLAYVGAAIGNLRVVICDTSRNGDSFKFYGVEPPAATLCDLAVGRAGLHDVLAKTPFLNFSLCAVADPAAIDRLASHPDILDPAFTVLRECFELVIIDAPPPNGNILGAALSRKADRVVMVVEAEKTRSPAARAAGRAIEANGGQILGAVLNKRRFHIPKALYRWL